jgi:hydrogenase expression/formation protein
LYKAGKAQDEIVKELAILSGSTAKADAILSEIINTENISDKFIADISSFEESMITADQSGLGCRGTGDFFIHHKIAELIDNKSTIIDPKQQDDGGVVEVDENYVTVAVDGMHSRLSHFPFIAGFHVARAAIRDIIVMGGEPKALFSDIHLANDGDVAKVFDYTAGIATVGELTNIPLIAGSTLRIGGDLVLGDRLTGCAGAVGFGKNITPRKLTAPGDVLIMTEGCGGGTIATTALYNGCSEVVSETLNLKIISFGKKLLNSDLITKIHALTDVTNGGLRGDTFEIANNANVCITLFEAKFKKLINPAVLDMLLKLDIDPLGVSIDSILIITPKNYAAEILKFIKNEGLDSDIVGFVEDTSEAKPEVKLIKEDISVTIEDISAFDSSAKTKLEPEYREAPYTPIKKVVNRKVKDIDSITTAIEDAVNKSKNKKEQLKDWITSSRRV